MKILVADDNHDIADSAAAFFEAAGHEVVTAYDGRQAINAARQSIPDAAILDIQMPEQDGFAVAQQMRSSHDLSSATLVAVTGLYGEEAQQNARDAGFDHVLTKPVSPIALLDLIGEHPDPKRLPQEPS